MAAGVVAGVVAIVGLFVVRNDARYLFDGLTSRALPLVVVSVVAGAASSQGCSSHKDRGGGQLPSFPGVWTSGRAPERPRLTATAGNTMTESTPAPTSAAAFSAASFPDSRPILAIRDEQRQGGRGEQHHPEPVHA